VGTIVVGVDGSPGADEALRHALREAQLRGSVVRVVTAWHVPAVAYGGMGAGPLVDPARAFAESAEAILRETLERVDGTRDVPVETVVREGRSANVLMDEAKDAELLVVGSRGHGGFTGLLLGSVSSECAHHATCPVMIVHRPAAA
jgi:nucleotide-binding universal stress UspA family protein